MKRFLLPLMMVPFLGLAQVGTGYIGINTDAPQGTLDVRGVPGDKTKFDGIIAPRITAEQLQAKAYSVEHTGSMVYVSTVPTTPSGQVAEINNPGYYYFNGAVWKSFLNDYDFSVFVPIGGTSDEKPINGALETVDPNYSFNIRDNQGYFSRTVEGEKAGFTILNTFEQAIPVMYRYDDDYGLEASIRIEPTAVYIEGAALIGSYVNPSSDNAYVQKHYVDSISVPAPPATGTYTLRSVNGVMQWSSSK